VPLLKINSPEFPLESEWPDASVTSPDEPLTVVPDRNVRVPLDPDTVDAPDATKTAPEEAAVLPELNTTEPLALALLLPEAMVTAPLAPDEVVPLLSTRLPLLPTDSEFAVRTVIEPEEDTDPPPLRTDTLPPTPSVDVVSPAAMATRPPVPLFVVPTKREIDPALPLVALPLASTTSPTRP
jgi:hypothetical protein